MKNIFYYLTIIFGIFTLASCSPTQDDNGDLLVGVDYDPASTTNPGTGTTTSRLIKKMTSHSYDEDLEEWEDSSLTYNYNGSKLVSYVDETGEITKFDYNSAGKISKMYNSGQTSVLEYSGSNISKATTTIPSTATVTATYTYSGGKLVKVISIQEYLIPIPMKLYVETTYEYSGNNLVKSVIKNGMYVGGELIMNPTDDQSISFAYDTKNSPYKLLPAEFIVTLAGIGPHGAALLSANNLTKVTITQSGASLSETYTHVYDSENYPTKSSGSDSDYTLFEYTK